MEYENTKLNEDLLKKMANSTKGKYYTYNNAQDLIEDINLEERIIMRTKEIALWDNFWFFIIFVGLLGVEWTIRKRRGLA